MVEELKVPIKEKMNVSQADIGCDDYYRCLDYPDKCQDCRRLEHKKHCFLPKEVK